MTDSNPIPLFFCCGEDCAGLPYKASALTHPLFCLSGEQFRRDLFAGQRDDNRPPPSPLASILRILDAVRELVDTVEAAE